MLKEGSPYSRSSPAAAGSGIAGADIALDRTADPENVCPVQPGDTQKCTSTGWDP